LEIKCEITGFASDNPLRGIKAHFMNLDINVLDNDSGIYQTSKFDKRRELPFQYSQYIQFRSNRPIQQSYSIAISQTVPILYLSSNITATYNEIEALIATLQGNGFQRPRLLDNIIKFLRENSFPGLKFQLPLLLDRLRYVTILICPCCKKENLCSAWCTPQ